MGGNTNDQLNITPIGASQTGSTGINVNGQLNGVYINNQTFTGVTSIYAVGFGGNDNFQFAGSLTIPSVVRAGDGNDTVNLGNGTNTVTLVPATTPSLPAMATTRCNSVTAPTP